jgi:hypothetical protein
MQKHDLDTLVFSPPDYPQLIRHRHTRHGRPPTRGQTL